MNLLRNVCLTILLFYFDLRHSVCCSANTECHAVQANQTNKCIYMTNPYCFDLELPYDHTHIPTHTSIKDFRKRFDRWQTLKRIPECWKAIQPIVCSILMPQCLENPIRLKKPSRETCLEFMAKGSCRFVERHFGMPALFNCSDSEIYQENCTNTLKEANVDYSCKYPLVPNKNNASQFKDIDQCGIHCKFPFLNTEDQAHISLFILALCLLGLSSTGIATTRSFANKTSKLNSAVSICIIYQLLNFVGWSFQIFSKKDIACHLDGSTITNMSIDRNLCFLSFLFTYICGTSGMLLLAYFIQVWHIQITNKTKLNVIETNFLLLSHYVPPVLAVLVVIVGMIDGHGLYGICTVGRQSLVSRIFFMILPNVFAVIYGNIYYFKTTAVLSRQKDSRPDASNGLFLITIVNILTTCNLIITSATFSYEKMNTNKWIDSVDEFVACDSNIKLLATYTDAIDNTKECAIENKPQVLLFYLEILFTFAPGIAITFWSYYTSRSDEISQDTSEVGPLDSVSIQSMTSTTLSQYLAPNRKSRFGHSFGSFRQQEPKHPPTNEVNLSALHQQMMMLNFLNQLTKSETNNQTKTDDYETYNSTEHRFL